MIDVLFDSCLFFFTEFRDLISFNSVDYPLVIDPVDSSFTNDFSS